MRRAIEDKSGNRDCQCWVSTSRREKRYQRTELEVGSRHSDSSLGVNDGRNLFGRGGSDLGMAVTQVGLRKEGFLEVSFCRGREDICLVPRRIERRRCEELTTPIPAVKSNFFVPS